MGLFQEMFEEPFEFENTPGGILSGKGARDAAERASQRQIEFQRETRELFRPIVEAGIAEIPELSRSATAEGFGQNIGEILQGESFAPLVEQRERAAAQALSSAGLRRSGQRARAAAQIPTDLALQIEGELNRRRQSIAGQGQSGAGNIGNVNTMIGQIMGQNAATHARIGQQSQQQAATVGAALLTAFSDPALKEDITVIGELGDLNVISWQWNDEAGKVYGLYGDSTGFNAEEVKEKYPQFIHNNDNFLTVDYDGLMEALNG